MFDAAQDRYDLIKTQLVSRESSNQEHGDVERFWTGKEKDLLRRLFQAYLDLQGVREERQSSVTVSDDIARARVWHDKNRNLETLFVTVNLTRYGYGALYPLDGRLNLPNERSSHGLEERVLKEREHFHNHASRYAVEVDHAA